MKEAFKPVPPTERVTDDATAYFADVFRRPSTRDTSTEWKQLEHALQTDHHVASLLGTDITPVYEITRDEEGHGTDWHKITPELQHGLRKAVFAREMDQADRGEAFGVAAEQLVQGWRSMPTEIFTKEEAHQLEDEHIGKQVMAEDKIDHELDRYRNTDDSMYGQTFGGEPKAPQDPLDGYPREK